MYGAGACVCCTVCVTRGEAACSLINSATGSLSDRFLQRHHACCKTSIQLLSAAVASRTCSWALLSGSQALSLGACHIWLLSCRMYIEEAIRDDGEVTDELEDDVADLELILGLGKKQSEEIVQTITANAYR